MFRCYIPECDNIDSPVYATHWLSNSIPFEHSKPSKCHRYEFTGYLDTHSNADSHSNRTVDVHTLDSNQICIKEESFNKSRIIRCDNDGFVYRTDEISIANEVSLS